LSALAECHVQYCLIDYSPIRLVIILIGLYYTTAAAATTITAVTTTARVVSIGP